MITTSGLTTTVVFGTADKASISVNAEFAKLILQQLANKEMKIGDLPKQEDIQELPKVECLFTEIESVDVMIKVLEKIKFHMQYPYGTYALAC